MSEQNANTKLPATFIHAQTLYTALQLQAKDDIYEGAVVALAQSVGVAGPAYANGFKALRAMGCVEQLQRGSSRSPTRIQLFYPPTYEAYSALDFAGLPNARTLTDKITEIEQTLRNIQANIGDTNIGEAFTGIAKKIHELDEEVQNLKEAQNNVDSVQGGDRS